MEENIAVVFIQLWSLQLEKFIFVASFSFPLSVGESWLFDTRCHGWEVVADWSRTGRGLRNS